MKRTACFVLAATVIKHSAKPHMKKLFEENKQRIKENFKRLALVSCETEETLSFLFFKMGVETTSEYRNLSFLNDSDFYDIIDTYELAKLLKTTSGNWFETWKLIEEQLTKINDEYGVAAEETIGRFKTVFDQIKSAILNCYNVDFNNVVFENFYWKGDDLVFRPF